MLHPRTNSHPITQHKSTQIGIKTLCLQPFPSRIENRLHPSKSHSKPFAINQIVRYTINLRQPLPKLPIMSYLDKVTVPTASSNTPSKSNHHPPKNQTPQAKHQTRQSQNQTPKPLNRIPHTTKPATTKCKLHFGRNSYTKTTANSQINPVFLYRYVGNNPAQTLRKYQ